MSFWSDDEGRGSWAVTTLIGFVFLVLIVCVFLALGTGWRQM